MDIRKEILKEHSKLQALKIAGFACKSEKNFQELIECFLDEDYRVSQRAAWSVSWAAKRKPEMINPHIKDLVAVLRKTAHDAVIRNSLRVLQEIQIPVEFHGVVMDACFRFLEQRLSAVAIKVFSLTVLFNLSKQYPEIKAEIKIIIEDNWDHQTAAFRSRGARVLKKL